MRESKELWYSGIHDSLDFYITGKHPLVHPTRGIFSAATTCLALLSSSLPIHMPPPAVQYRARIPTYRLHRRGRWGHAISVLGRKRHDKSHRTNLSRDLSQIMLSLGRIPLTRIGSFTLDNKGVLSLTNRPLTLQLQDLENGGIPDLLAYHDSRLRY